MSGIATFYLVPDERLSAIVAAATPNARGWFRPTRDTFSSVLATAGHAPETFAWSGWAFNTLDLYLESRHGLTYANFGDIALSRQLSKARGSDWLVMPADSAARLAAALEPVECETDDVRTFIASERGPDVAADEVAAVQAALATLKVWLGKVRAGSTALLSIG